MKRFSKDNYSIDDSLNELMNESGVIVFENVSYSQRLSQF